MGQKRKIPQPSSAGSKAGPKNTSSGSRRSSSTTTTDKEFGPQLHKNGIRFGDYQVIEANDSETVKEYLNRRRNSNSPDEEDYERFIQMVKYGHNELTVQSNAWQLLSGPSSRYQISGYGAEYNVQWSEVESPLTYGISDARPDISEAYRVAQYPADAIDTLGSSLAPTQYSAAMPLFCAEWKGPGGAMDCADKQAAYDGALMVEAAYEAHKYTGKAKGEFFSNTQALTVALNGETIQITGNHVTEKRSRTEYHNYRLVMDRPLASFEHFKETCKHIRNAQDWARERATRTKASLTACSEHMENERSHLPKVIGEIETETADWSWSSPHGSFYYLHPSKTIEWAKPVKVAPAFTEWIWSKVHNSAFRISPSGSIQWKATNAPTPAVTPPSTNTSGSGENPKPSNGDESKANSCKKPKVDLEG